jgi:hypothetical protein
VENDMKKMKESPILIFKDRGGKFIFHDVMLEKKYEFKNTDELFKFIVENYVDTKGNYAVIHTAQIVIGTKSLKGDFDSGIKFSKVLYYIFKELM